MCRLLLFLLLPALAVSNPCADIDSAFHAALDTANDTVACRCFSDPPNHSVSFDEADAVWIGCSGHVAPHIHAALRSLNATRVGRLQIWDSQLNAIPPHMFEQVQPRQLIIENSGLSSFSQAPFADMGERVSHLRLRHNLLRSIDDSLLQGLHKLDVFDLSGNSISSISPSAFQSVKEVRELYLNENALSSLPPRAFEKMGQLRVLSIGANQLTNITKDCFAGLSQLESLHLRGNAIENIEEGAFAHMKHLRQLDLGGNSLSSLSLSGLPQLEKLLLNNNKFASLSAVKLSALPSLQSLSLDRNGVSEWRAGELSGLSDSTRLQSLSLAANNISKISAGAVKAVSCVSILALQNNRVHSLSHSGAPFLAPLTNITTLLLSGNAVEELRSGELPTTLKFLSLDHNQISNVEEGALAGLSQLQRLYLNNNHIPFLPRNAFTSLSMNTLEAIDVTSNSWQCVCAEEWLGAWLEAAGDRDVGEGPLGCLASRRCNTEEQQTDDTRSTWITVAASVLAAVSLLILVAIIYLYYDDGRQRILLAKPLHRRVDSDLLRLINDAEPLVVPAPRSPKEGEKRVRFNDSH